MSHEDPHNAVSATGQEQIITTPPEVAVESAHSTQAISVYAPVIPITQIPTNPVPTDANGLTPAQIEFAHSLYNRSIPFPMSPG